MKFLFSKRIIGLASMLGATFFSVEAFAKSGLMPGERIYAGEALTSENGCFWLSLQGDGNLVLYKKGQVLWASNTAPLSARYLEMEGDGNLVLRMYDGVASWHSQTANHDGSRLSLQNDGNLVIYAPFTGRALWATDTVSPCE